MLQCSPPIACLRVRLKSSSVLIVTACLSEASTGLSSLERRAGLSKRDEICWVCTTWMLDDVNLRAGERIHGTIVAVWLLSEWQDTAVLRAAQAWHPGPEQAHKHLLRSICPH